MATPRTRLPRVSAGCFQKIPRFARFRRDLIHPTGLYRNSAEP